MTKRLFILAHPEARRRACQAVAEAPDGHTVTIAEPRRNGEQNALLHAVISEIADQVEWCGKRLSAEIWKRLCVAAWLREAGEHPTLIPALDGNGFDVVFEKTSKLSKKQCSELIEWCFAFGAQHGVVFRAGTVADNTRIQSLHGERFGPS